MQPQINLREERSFGEKFNAVFAFFGQNFKPLATALALIAGPFAILSGIGASFYQSAVIAETQNGTILSSNPFGSWQYWLILGATALGYLFNALVVYAYVAEYLDGNRDISISDIWNRVSGKIFTTLGAGILATLACIVGCLLLLIPGIYLMFALSLVGIVIMIEGLGAGESLSRSRSLIKGYWWSTFGLLFVIAIVQALISYVIALPYGMLLGLSATNFISGEISLLLIAVGILSQFLAIMTYSLSNLAVVFQYFNLVEKKEGVGLVEQLDQLGENSVEPA